MFDFLNKPNVHRAATKLYAAIVLQARDPRLYRHGGVPDTEDGRYDMILLHMFLVLERLAHAPEDVDALKQALFDILFQDLDDNLREMGYGDTGVRIRIQKMVEGFYGRMSAYREGIAATDATSQLAAALRRNVYRHGEPSDKAVDRMCGYVRSQWIAIQAQDATELAAGTLIFPDVDMMGMSADAG